jgi:hypothetical protein
MASVIPSVPGIVRTAPHGPITRPAQGIPVLARLRWQHGREQEIPVIATGWTRDAVEIIWEVRVGDLRSDWIPATDVRRANDPLRPVNAPPDTHAGRPRARR